MKRDPSLHITKSEFSKICDLLGHKDFPIDTFFSFAKKNTLYSRGVIVSNKKTTKRVNNLLLVKTGDANLIADIIYASRIKLKHRGVRKITEADSRQWVNCKKLASICNTFCNDFGLETREGFIQYIEIGLSRMSDYKNLLQRLISMEENIVAQYECVKDLRSLSRSDMDIVMNLHNQFVNRVADATGILEDHSKDPTKLIHFKRLKDFLEEKGWLDRDDYMEAQFDSLTWCNGLPQISDLYSDKAVSRFNKYLYKIRNKSEASEEPEFSGGLWAQINKN